jgi:hypothetical protein
MGNRLWPVFCVTAAVLAASSCRQQERSADNQATYNRLPTATEVFDLRSKCAALGDRILSENVIGSALTQDQISHYSPATNHCYVKLEVFTSDLTTPREKFIRDDFLYDGQTKETLASAYWDGNRKSGIIYSDSLKTFVHDPTLPSYEKTVALMDRFVAEDRKP